MAQLVPTWVYLMSNKWFPWTRSLESMNVILRSGNSTVCCLTWPIYSWLPYETPAGFPSSTVCPLQINSHPGSHSPFSSIFFYWSRRSFSIVVCMFTRGLSKLRSAGRSENSTKRSRWCWATWKQLMVLQLWIKTIVHTWMFAVNGGIAILYDKFIFLYSRNINDSDDDVVFKWK